MLDLSPDELLTTTRAVRRRLDLDRAVEPAVIRECLEIAMQAPTGSNAQGWHWVVVTDPDKRAAIAEAYRKGARGYLLPADGDDADPLGGAVEADEQLARLVSSARYLVDNIHRVPALVIPCIWGRLGDSESSGDERSPAFSGTALQAGFWGSIFPAVWSLQLALRARGLGSCLTTFHLADEQGVAELLGIPYERCTQVCLLPVAYTLGADFRPAPRQDPDKVVHWDHW